MRNSAILIQPASSHWPTMIPGTALMFGVYVGMLVSGMHPVMPEIVRAIGVLLVLLYAGCHFLYRLKVPVELVLFGLFVIWATVSGLVMAEDASRCLKHARMIAQIWALGLASCGFAMAWRSQTPHWIICLIPAVVLGWVNWEFGFYEAGFGTDIRHRGPLPWNPNFLGLFLLNGVMACAYLWRFGRSRYSRLFRFAIPPAVVFLALNVLSTASRKSFAGLLAFGLLYAWFCYRREVFRNLGAVITVAAVLAGGYLLVDYMLHGGTILALRFEESVQEGGLDARRTSYYVRGVDLFLQHPITGIGLGNFVYYTTKDLTGVGGEAHSEYIQLLATTGVVGAIIYFPIYFLLWRRLCRVEKSTSDPDTRYYVGVSKATLITLLALGIGRQLFLSPFAWFMLATIIGFAHSEERVLRGRVVRVPRQTSVLHPQPLG